MLLNMLQNQSNEIHLSIEEWNSHTHRERERMTVRAHASKQTWAEHSEFRKSLKEREPKYFPTNNSTACSNQLFNKKYIRLCTAVLSPALLCSARLCVYQNKMRRMLCAKQSFSLHCFVLIFLDLLSCYEFPLRIPNIWPAVESKLANVLFIPLPHNFFLHGSFMLRESTRTHT